MKRLFIAAAFAAAPAAALADGSVDINITGEMPEVCLIAPANADINNLTAFTGAIDVDLGELNDGDVSTDATGGFDGETDVVSWVVGQGFQGANNPRFMVFCNTPSTISATVSEGSDFVLVNKTFTGVADDGFETTVPFNLVLDGPGGNDPDFTSESDTFSQNGWHRVVQPRVGLTEATKAMEGTYEQTVTVTVKAIN